MCHLLVILRPVLMYLATRNLPLLQIVIPSYIPLIDALIVVLTLFVNNMIRNMNTINTGLTEIIHSISIVVITKQHNSGAVDISKGVVYHLCTALLLA